MSSIFFIMKPILLSFVAQEEDDYKLVLYLRIPELRVHRSCGRHDKHTVSNGSHEFIEFQNQSFNFSIKIENKFYSMSVRRLPDLIEPKHCFVTYEDGGCWITLIKLKPITWMNQICHDLHPGLDILQHDN
mgnify:FL=1